MPRIEELFLKHSRQIMKITDVLEDLAIGCTDLSQRLETLEGKIKDMENAKQKHPTD